MTGVPPLHVVTDDRVLEDPGFEGRAREALGAGGGSMALHLRGPRTSGRRMYELARALLAPARESGTLLLANDRADVALAAGLQGVHLGERSLPVRIARRLLPEGHLVGCSVHGPDGAAAASDAGPDYLIVGTIFDTRSHPGRRGAGPDLISRVGGVTDLPLFAIGGITPERVAELVARGVRGVAVLRGVWDAQHPAVAVDRYRSALEEAGIGGGRPRPGSSEEDEA